MAVLKYWDPVAGQWRLLPGGAQGATGPAGPAGPTGPIGPAGADGTSVTIKGTVPDEGSLPPTGNVNGDGYIVQATGHLWVWDGVGWTDAGEIRGPAGPPGPTAVSADPGNAAVLGSDNLVYVSEDHIQVVAFDVPSDTWVVDIGKPIVAVTVLDSDRPPREVWPGEIVHPDSGSTAITLKFSAPFSGRVYCYS